MIIDRVLRLIGIKREEKSTKEVLKELKKEEKRLKKRKTKKDLIVEYLKGRKTPAKVEEIAEKVGATVQTTRRYLYYLAKEGKVERKGEGWVAK